MSYSAAYGGHDRISAERRLLRDHPLGLRKFYADPADEVDENGAARKWTFGVAAGALLVAGTFAAGALGLNNVAAPFIDGAAPEHAPAAPGNGPGDIGGPAAVAPPQEVADRKPAAERAERPTTPSSAGQQGTAVPGAEQGHRVPDGTVSGDIYDPAPEPAPAPAPAPRPAPAPDQAPAPKPKPKPGPLEQVVTPVTDTVGGIVTPVTDTVGDLLSPVTGVLSAGDQPALAMINPLGDLLGR